MVLYSQRRVGVELLSPSDCSKDYYWCEVTMYKASVIKS